MCKITYDPLECKWSSSDSKPVIFRVKTPGFNIDLDTETTVDLFIKGKTFWVTEHYSNTFKIFEDFKGDIQLFEFEIERGHPAYEFFKKEMIRDGVTHLKPLDATENWQEY